MNHKESTPPAARKKTSLRLSRFRAGDEVVFKYEGNLTGTVERVSFRGRSVSYTVTATYTFEVPDSLVVGAEREVYGERGRA